jgi:hypothetical protein
MSTTGATMSAIAASDESFIAVMVPAAAAALTSGLL